MKYRGFANTMTEKHDDSKTKQKDDAKIATRPVKTIEITKENNKVTNENKSDGTQENNFKEIAALAIIAIVVFAGVFYLGTSTKKCETNLDGLKVISCNPTKEFKEILTKDAEFDFTVYNSTKFKGTVVELDLTNSNSSHNSIVGAVAAEVASSLVLSGRNATAIGVVNGTVTEFKNVPAEKKQELLNKTAFIVRTGECNCLKTSGGKIIFEGSEEYLTQHLLKIRGIVRAVLAS